MKFKLDRICRAIDEYHSISNSDRMLIQVDVQSQLANLKQDLSSEFRGLAAGLV